MAYRGASTVKWFEMAGCQAAYMPIAAPTQVDSYQNMGRGMLGVYTASLGVAPTWTLQTGWGFDGSTQWLNTGIVPMAGCSAIVRFVPSATAEEYDCLLSAYNSSTARAELWSIGEINPHRLGVTYGNKVVATIATSAMVLALTPAGQYANGVFTAFSDTPTWSIVTNAFTIATRASGSWYEGAIQSLAIYSRTLTAAEVWDAYIQMKYCDVCDDYNVWKPQRRYYFMSTTVAAGISWRVVGNTFIRGKL